MSIRLIESFWNICLLHGITTRDDLLREAVRVIRTKRMYEKLHPNAVIVDADEIFSIMRQKIGERELGPFAGDRDLFLRLYQAGERLNLLEYAQSTLQQDRVTGTMLAHPGIFRQFVEKGKAMGASSVLIAEAEKYIKGLVAEAIHKTFDHITLLTENYIVGRLLKTHYESYDHVQILQGSIYQPLPLDVRADAILAIPNFGMKIMESEEGVVRESETAAIHHLAPLLEEGGFLSATLPAKVMFQSGPIAEWRKTIHEQMPVRTIQALPDGLFRPYTSVKTYQVEFVKGPAADVRVGRMHLSGNQLEVEREETIHADRFKEMEDWRIELLLDQDQETLQQYRQAPVPKVKLKEVAEIFRGKSILKQDLKPGNLKVLNISNLEDGEIDFAGMETIDEEEKKVRRYALKPGDLVMTCRGTVIKFAVVPETKERVIASANIVVIRFTSQDVLSHYVKIFLESPTGTALIQSFQRGTTLLNLNPSDVAEIEVPLLSLDMQTSIVRRYLQEKADYREAIRAATARWEATLNNLYNELY